MEYSTNYSRVNHPKPVATLTSLRRAKKVPIERSIHPISGGRIGITKLGNTLTEKGTTLSPAAVHDLTKASHGIVAANNILKFGLASDLLPILGLVVDLRNQVSGRYNVELNLAEK